MSEISRLARANGGKPLGFQAFEKATGIRRSDWYGVYWARWGDAVAEAGFAPNVLRTKLDSDFMLTKVAIAARHFGKIPTDGELRLFARQNPGFPSHTTISDHFPTKSDLARALHAWLPGKPEFIDLVVLLPAPTPEPLPTRSTKVRLGSVYLLKSGDHYKIGRSDELERRVKSIRVALPEAATLIHTITTDDPPGIEAYWHRRFADRRAHGEWFRLTPTDVLAFRRRSFQ